MSGLKVQGGGHGLGHELDPAEAEIGEGGTGEAGAVRSPRRRVGHDDARRLALPFADGVDHVGDDPREKLLRGKPMTCHEQRHVVAEAARELPDQAFGLEEPALLGDLAEQ